MMREFTDMFMCNLSADAAILVDEIKARAAKGETEIHICAHHMAIFTAHLDKTDKADCEKDLKIGTTTIKPSA